MTGTVLLSSGWRVLAVEGDRRLRLSARVAAELFGDRDAWAAEPDVTAHRRSEVERLLIGIVAADVDKKELDGKSFLSDKHRHVFHIAARQALEAPS